MCSRFEDCPKLNAGAGNIGLSSGTNRNLGRWSKHGERNEATPSLGGCVPSKDDLIAIGPDGKGGNIKVLRSKPQIYVSYSSSNPLVSINLRFSSHYVTSFIT